ncbi:hypothetical protein [Methylomicrobium lacus]|uniref:hypothetical protein n=1 Tax=Methylomicrobium lacus TaxID=136992 RepID=UPI0035A8C6C6
MELWIFLTIVVLLISLGLIVRATKKRNIDTALAAREALTDEEIYRRFYASLGLNKTEVIELWHEIAEILRVPAERMRPSDKFGKDIGTYWITSEELDILSTAAQQRAKLRGLTIDLASIKTVDDYVKRLARGLDI